MTQVATRPGRLSSQEDFLPTQLEHLHIAQFKGQGSEFKLRLCIFLVSIFVSLLLILRSCLLAAGDLSGAVQTLRSLLLFYPSDKDSLDNLQLYYETLGGDAESPGTQPAQVTLDVHYILYLYIYSII